MQAPIYRLFLKLNVVIIVSLILIVLILKLDYFLKEDFRIYKALEVSSYSGQ